MILPSPNAHSGHSLIWTLASDLLIVTMLIWTLPLLLGVAAALLRGLADLI